MQRVSCLSIQKYPRPLRCRYLSSISRPKPFEILFCGSDAFSIHSLHALHKLSLRSTKSLNTTDSGSSGTQTPRITLSVVCRPDKPTGRGLRSLAPVPIKPIAQRLSLPIHELDTFTNWTPSRIPDLIVAVSFGLRVPARLLNAARYGGLNVHPSLLPDLKGPAPIQWTLLDGDRYTGVTVQTLHPSRIDEGQIVSQTAAPGVEVPRNAKREEMVELLGRQGAEMLASCVEEMVTSGNDEAQGMTLSDMSRSHGAQAQEGRSRYAPKIKPEHRRLDISWDAETLLRRDRIIGPLWDMVDLANLARGNTNASFDMSQAEHTSKPVRVTMSGWHQLEDDRQECIAHGLFLSRGAKDEQLCFKTCDGKVVAPTQITVEGRPRTSNQSFARSVVEKYDRRLI